jgi:hypothetical protein
MTRKEAECRKREMIRAEEGLMSEKMSADLERVRL